MYDYIEKKRLAMLKIIRDSAGPISSHDICTILQDMDYDISERTVRFDLLAMDRAGHTEYLRKKGRRITDIGLLELSKARVIDRLGFFAAKIDQMIYRMNFDLNLMKGTVLINFSLIKKEFFNEAAPLIKKVFAARLGMGTLMAILEPGEEFDGSVVPDGYLGIGTVCSITINGILLHHGIPVRSKFGGVLEMEGGVARRFVALINYDGTTLDPLEIFIKSRMTNYRGATETGNGLIGASFREIPHESREQVFELSAKLDSIGLGAFMEIGNDGKSIVGIPVNSGAVGCVVIGGLNPIAIVVESGIDMESKAMAGLIDFERLFPYTEIDRFM